MNSFVSKQNFNLIAVKNTFFYVQEYEMVIGIIYAYFKLLFLDKYLILSCLFCNSLELRPVHTL